MKYGVKLITYKDQVFNTWIYDDKDPFITDDLNQAKLLCEEFSGRNPGGLYQIIEISDEEAKSLC